MPKWPMKGGRVPDRRRWPLGDKSPLPPPWPTSGDIAGEALEIIGATPVTWLYDPGRSPTLVSGALRAMPNLSLPGTRDATASPLADCVYTATGGPSGRASFDSAATVDVPDAFMRASSGTPGPPGTTPLFWYAILRLNSVVSNQFLLSATNGPRLQRFNAETNVSAFNGTISTKLAMATGTWYRVWCKFANSVSVDELKVGPLSTGVGTAFGNAAGSQPTGIGGSVAMATNAGLVSCAFAMELSAIPSAKQMAQLDALLSDANAFSGVSF